MIFTGKDFKERAPWETDTEDQEEKRAKLFEEEPFRRKGQCIEMS